MFSCVGVSGLVVRVSDLGKVLIYYVLRLTQRPTICGTGNE